MKEKKTEKRYTPIEFTSDGGKRVRLIFEKSEYRAYAYDKIAGKWYDMKLGGLDTGVLISYIKSNF